MYRADHQASYFSKYIFKAYKLFALYNRETTLIPVLNPSSPNCVFNPDSLNNINTNSSIVIIRDTKLAEKKIYVPFWAEWAN